VGIARGKESVNYSLVLLRRANLFGAAPTGSVGEWSYLRVGLCPRKNAAGMGGQTRGLAVGKRGRSLAVA